jgi:hypothetical protein
MKVWQTSCIAAAVASVGLYLAAGNRPAGTGPDVMTGAAANIAAPANMTAPANMATPALYAEAIGQTCDSASGRKSRAGLGDDSRFRAVEHRSGDRR